MNKGSFIAAVILELIGMELCPLLGSVGHSNGLEGCALDCTIYFKRK